VCVCVCVVCVCDVCIWFWCMCACVCGVCMYSVCEFELWKERRLAGLGTAPYGTGDGEGVCLGAILFHFLQEKLFLNW